MTRAPRLPPVGSGGAEAGSPGPLRLSPPEGVASRRRRPLPRRFPHRRREQKRPATPPGPLAVCCRAAPSIRCCACRPRDRTHSAGQGGWAVVLALKQLNKSNTRGALFRAGCCWQFSPHEQAGAAVWGAWAQAGRSQAPAETPLCLSFLDGYYGVGIGQVYRTGPPVQACPRPAHLITTSPPRNELRLQEVCVIN